MGPTFTIIEGLEIPLEEEDAKLLGVPWKESAPQGPLEAWAVKLERQGRCRSPSRERAKSRSQHELRRGSRLQ